MVKSSPPSGFLIDRDDERCIRCQACVRMCSNDVHAYDPEEDIIVSDSSKCVGCHFCEAICPTSALTVRHNPSQYRENFNWTSEVINDIKTQAGSGGVILTGMGCDKPYPIYWDHIVLNASQVTNPSIDPLREPMELETFIGRKPDKIAIESSAEPKRATEISP